MSHSYRFILYFRYLMPNAMCVKVKFRAINKKFKETLRVSLNTSVSLSEKVILESRLSLALGKVLCVWQQVKLSTRARNKTGSGFVSEWNLSARIRDTVSTSNWGVRLELTYIHNPWEQISLKKKELRFHCRLCRILLGLLALNQQTCLYFFSVTAASLKCFVSYCI